jgi:hypothetical protein
MGSPQTLISYARVRGDKQELGPVKTNEIVLRPAEAVDEEAMCDQLLGNPLSEVAALVGNVDRGREFGRLIEKSCPIAVWEMCAVAECHGECCGVLQQGTAEKEFNAGPLFLISLFRLCRTRREVKRPYNDRSHDEDQ